MYIKFIIYIIYIRVVLRYHLMKRDGSRQHVCRVMFAHTFGMLPNSDFIYRLLQATPNGRRVPSTSTRGKAPPPNKVSR